MAWAPATTYAARIGGIIYRDVARPVVLNGRSLISLFRDSDTGRLAASLELTRQDGKPIASVTHSVITLRDEADFLMAQGPRRTAVVERNTGRVWCDIKSAPKNFDYELDVSALFFSDAGYPVLLHPDRTKIGTSNDNQPPNIAFLTVSVSPESMVLSGVSTTNGTLYALSIAIERPLVGLMITHKS